MIRYLTLKEVITVHDRILKQSGGAEGIRDLGSLESALAQPKMTFGNDIWWRRAVSNCYRESCGIEFFDRDESSFCGWQ